MNHLNNWQLGLTYLGVTCKRHHYRFEPPDIKGFQLRIRELIKERLPSNEKIMEEVSKIINSNIIINEFTYLKEGFDFYDQEYNKYHYKVRHENGTIFYNRDGGCCSF